MRITDKIHLLKIDFEVALTPEKKLQRFVNVLIILGKQITLIDTGVKGSEGIVADYLKQNNRNFSEIKTILLSHSHPDHVGSAAAIKEITGCNVLSHRGELEWIENIEMQNSQRPVPGFFNLVDRSVKVDQYLVDGQEIHVDNGLTMKIIHSPGHSKGSLNVLFPENRILFTADSIPLKNDIPNYDSYPDLIRSLATIRESETYDTLLTSWTPPMFDRNEINTILTEGEEYLKQIDSAVKESYTNGTSEPFSSCQNAVAKLGLPPFFVNQLVENAFRSHLKV
jgi:glyoxylase-like metal-dependent hydrolase (beta-lactamase superfamily II)